MAEKKTPSCLFPSAGSSKKPQSILASVKRSSSWLNVGSSFDPNPAKAQKLGGEGENWQGEDIRSRPTAADYFNQSESPSNPSSHCAGPGIGPQKPDQDQSKTKVNKAKKQKSQKRRKRERQKESKKSRVKRSGRELQKLLSTPDFDKGNVTSEDKPETGLEWVIDRHGDNDLVQFGKLYYKEVPNYRKVKGFLVGVLDRTQTRHILKEIAKNPHLGEEAEEQQGNHLIDKKRSHRFFSKKSQKSLKGHVTIPTIQKRVHPVLGQHLERKESRVERPFLTLEVPYEDLSSIMKKTLQEARTGQTTSHEEYYLRKTKEFNKRTQQYPWEIEGWLEFIQFHDQVKTHFHTKASCQVRKLEIVSKALEYEENKKDPRLLYLRLKLVDAVQNMASLNREKYDTLWRDTLMTNPKCAIILNNYFQYAFCNFDRFQLTMFESDVKEITQILLSSHKNDPTNLNSECVIIDFLAELSSIWEQAGFEERMIGIWQALLEFNFFIPEAYKKSPPSAQLMDHFKDFWDLEGNRVGDSFDKHGWETHTQHSHSSSSSLPDSVPYDEEFISNLDMSQWSSKLNITEDLNESLQSRDLNSTLSLRSNFDDLKMSPNKPRESVSKNGRSQSFYAGLAQRERCRQNYRPLKSFYDDGKVNDQIESIVFFDDIECYLFNFKTEEAQLHLVFRFLESVGMPAPAIRSSSCRTVSSLNHLWNLIGTRGSANFTRERWNSLQSELEDAYMGLIPTKWNPTPYVFELTRRVVFKMREKLYDLRGGLITALYVQIESFNQDWKGNGRKKCKAVLKKENRLYPWLSFVESEYRRGDEKSSLSIVHKLLQLYNAKEDKALILWMFVVTRLRSSDATLRELRYLFLLFAEPPKGNFEDKVAEIRSQTEDLSQVKVLKLAHYLLKEFELSGKSQSVKFWNLHMDYNGLIFCILQWVYGLNYGSEEAITFFNQHLNEIVSKNWMISRCQEQTSETLYFHHIFMLKNLSRYSYVNFKIFKDRIAKNISSHPLDLYSPLLLLNVIGGETLASRSRSFKSRLQDATPNLAQHCLFLMKEMVLQATRPQEQRENLENSFYDSLATDDDNYITKISNEEKNANIFNRCDHASFSRQQGYKSLLWKMFLVYGGALAIGDEEKYTRIFNAAIRYCPFSKELYLQYLEQNTPNRNLEELENALKYATLKELRFRIDYDIQT